MEGFPGRGRLRIRALGLREINHRAGPENPRVVRRDQIFLPPILRPNPANEADQLLGRRLDFENALNLENGENLTNADEAGYFDRFNNLVEGNKKKLRRNTWGLEEDDPFIENSSSEEEFAGINAQETRDNYNGDLTMEFQTTVSKKIRQAINVLRSLSLIQKLFQEPVMVRAVEDCKNSSDLAVRFNGLLVEAIINDDDVKLYDLMADRIAQSESSWLKTLVSPALLNNLPESVLQQVINDSMTAILRLVNSKREGSVPEPGLVLGIERLPLLDFMTTIGSSLLVLNHNSKRCISFTIQFDLLHEFQFFWVEPQTTLITLKFSDLRAKLKEKLRFDFLFMQRGALMANENQNLFGDHISSHYKVAIARFTPSIEDFETCVVSGLDRKSVMLGKYSLGGRTAYFASLATFGSKMILKYFEGLQKTWLATSNIAGLDSLQWSILPSDSGNTFDFSLNSPQKQEIETVLQNSPTISQVESDNASLLSTLTDFDKFRNIDISKVGFVVVNRTFHSIMTQRKWNRLDQFISTFDIEGHSFVLKKSVMKCEGYKTDFMNTTLANGLDRLRKMRLRLTVDYIFERQDTILNTD